MTRTNVEISPSILKWVLGQIDPAMAGEHVFDNVSNWVSGKKQPTFAQVKKLSSKTNIPLGYFFLETPPKEEIELLDFRTVNSGKLEHPSRELIDTIYKMESVRDWMRDYRIESGYDELDIVGSVNEQMSSEEIAAKIRDDLGIPGHWFLNCNNMRESFKFIRNCLEDDQVVVMMTGIVGNNTNRLLNVEEFRAFAMTDEHAPLIFINNCDTDSGKLFSLLHEAVHIWLDKNDFFNAVSIEDDTYDKVEKICNETAAEILMPNQLFVEYWKQSEISDMKLKLNQTAQYFKCGIVVTARRALDHAFISKAVYRDIAEAAAKGYKKKKTSGGNYYNTMNSRLDKNFVHAVCNSLNAGKMRYTDAYDLTGTSYKTFPKIAADFGDAI